MKQKAKGNEYIWSNAGTDITIRWRKFYNWIAPSEQEEYRKKWKYYQDLSIRTLDDVK